MKLRYLIARNVLSFGDEGVKLELGPFSIIAGPNDSGKTNLFRVLGLIEQAFNYGKPPLEEILFRGDTDRPLLLEVGVELDDVELKLLTTQIICSEIMSVQRPEDITKGIDENKRWKGILESYGYQILSKSLKCLSFVLSKDELRISEPKIVARMSDETGILYINRQSQLSETSQELGSYQRMSLTKAIIENFVSRFGNLSETDADSLIQDVQKLSIESPTLTELLKGKLGGSPHKLVELRGANFNEYSNALRAEPILSELYMLCEQKGISQEGGLYLWQILEQMYKTSFVRLLELRLSLSTSAHSSSGQDSKEATVLGTDLARKLFRLMTSRTRKNREKYSRVQTEFENLTGSQFEVVASEREVDISEEKLGMMTPSRTEFAYSSGPQFTPLGVGTERRRQLVNEASIQIIKDNYPIILEQAASGLYEILFLLTTIVGENGKILLLDEPELHLHPTMQKRILNLLSESRTQGGNQILLITHSPYLTSAADIGATWRFAMTEHGTKVHNLGKVLSELESKEYGNLVVKLRSPDVRSILFSRGVILVEGPSDKIVVEQIDRYLSAKENGANIDESEWPIIDIGGKKSLPSFLILSRMLAVPSLAILDYDALMHRTDTIRLNCQEVKTSTILFTLLRTDKLRKWQDYEDLLSKVPESEWYENSYLEKLRSLALKHGIFVFSMDLEGVMQSPKNGKNRKPLRALERILDLINQDNIPSEFYEMCKFLRSRTSYQRRRTQT